MSKVNTVFRVQKNGKFSGLSVSNSRVQKTPSGNTVITVSRETYNSALSAASKVISRVGKTGSK